MDGHNAVADDDGPMLDSIRKWLDRDVRPHVLELEHADTYPAEMVEQMKALGLFGATISEEYGGGRPDGATRQPPATAVSETCSSADATHCTYYRHTPAR